MDTKEEDLVAQEPLDQVDSTLAQSAIGSSPFTIGANQFDTYHYPDLDMSSILSSSSADTITISGFDASAATYNTMSAFGPYSNTGPYTINTSVPSNTTSSGQINLNGDDADIVINGVSLMDLLKDRLNIMIPDPRLEADWDELKALGDQYRALEKKLKEQSEMWARLKSMPLSNPL